MTTIELIELFEEIYKVDIRTKGIEQRISFPRAIYYKYRIEHLKAAARFTAEEIGFSADAARLSVKKFYDMKKNNTTFWDYVKKFENRMNIKL